MNSLVHILKNHLVFSFVLLISIVPSYGNDLVKALVGVLNTPDIDTNNEFLISGRAFHHKDNKEYPLRNVEITLSQRGKVIAKSKTSHRGEFSFFSKLLEGDCTIELPKCKYIHKFEANNRNSDILVACPNE